MKVKYIVNAFIYFYREKLARTTWVCMQLSSPEIMNCRTNFLSLEKPWLPYTVQENIIHRLSMITMKILFWLSRVVPSRTNSGWSLCTTLVEMSNLKRFVQNRRRFLKEQNKPKRKQHVKLWIHRDLFPTRLQQIHRQLVLVLIQQLVHKQA